MTTMVWTYLFYLTICVAITIWVAKTLHRYGVAFVTSGHEASAELINAHAHLLIVGYYLLSIGAISFALRYGGKADDATTAIEVLSTKVGGIVLGIGALHFAMMTVFAKMRRAIERRVRDVPYAVDAEVRS